TISSTGKMPRALRRTPAQRQAARSRGSRRSPRAAGGRRRGRGWSCQIISVRAAERAAPILTGAEFLVAALIVPHAAGRLVERRHEAVAVTHAAIVRGLHLVPHQEARFGHTAVVDADRLDPAAYHQAIHPFARPLDFAFEMAAALGDARRAQTARRDPGE